MGLLDVFKKKNQESSFQFPSEHDLELPPPPPTDDLGMEELPNIEPEASLPDSSELPDFDVSNLSQDMQAPSFPDFPEQEKQENQLPDEEENEIVVEHPQRASLPAVPSTVSSSANNFFIKVEDFKEFIAQQSAARSSLKYLNDSLNKINEMRTEEDREFTRWHSQASDVLRKLTYVDKVLFEKSIEN
ncbi:hypothetical protein J4206_02520 [Candidatus Woesearchaeota archaeon]|nr:hypothetical protein [Candidatus Woesearchaeota archaeon]